LERIDVVIGNRPSLDDLERCRVVRATAVPSERFSFRPPRFGHERRIAKLHAIGLRAGVEVLSPPSDSMSTDAAADLTPTGSTTVDRPVEQWPGHEEDPSHFDQRRDPPQHP